MNYSKQKGLTTEDLRYPLPERVAKYFCYSSVPYTQELQTRIELSMKEVISSSEMYFLSEYFNATFFFNKNPLQKIVSLRRYLAMRKVLTRLKHSHRFHSTCLWASNI